MASIGDDDKKGWAGVLQEKVVDTSKNVTEFYTKGWKGFGGGLVDFFKDPAKKTKQVGETLATPFNAGVNFAKAGWNLVTGDKDVWGTVDTGIVDISKAKIDDKDRELSQKWKDIGALEMAGDFLSPLVKIGKDSILGSDIEQNLKKGVDLKKFQNDLESIQNEIFSLEGIKEDDYIELITFYNNVANQYLERRGLDKIEDESDFNTFLNTKLTELDPEQARKIFSQQEDYNAKIDELSKKEQDILAKRNQLIEENIAGGVAKFNEIQAAGEDMLKDNRTLQFLQELSEIEEERVDNDLMRLDIQKLSDYEGLNNTKEKLVENRTRDRQFELDILGSDIPYAETYSKIAKSLNEIHYKFQLDQVQEFTKLRNLSENKGLSNLELKELALKNVWDRMNDLEKNQYLLKEPFVTSIAQMKFSISSKQKEWYDPRWVLNQLSFFGTTVQKAVDKAYEGTDGVPHYVQQENRSLIYSDEGNWDKFKSVLSYNGDAFLSMGMDLMLSRSTVGKAVDGGVSLLGKLPELVNKTDKIVTIPMKIGFGNNTVKVVGRNVKDLTLSQLYGAGIDPIFDNLMVQAPTDTIQNFNILANALFDVAPLTVKGAISGKNLIGNELSFQFLHGDQKEAIRGIQQILKDNGISLGKGDIKQQLDDIYTMTYRNVYNPQEFAEMLVTPGAIYKTVKENLDQMDQAGLKNLLTHKGFAISKEDALGLNKDVLNGFRHNVDILNKQATNDAERLEQLMVLKSLQDQIDNVRKGFDAEGINGVVMRESALGDSGFIKLKTEAEQKAKQLEGIIRSRATEIKRSNQPGTKFVFDKSNDVNIDYFNDILEETNDLLIDAQKKYSVNGGVNVVHLYDGELNKYTFDLKTLEEDTGLTLKDLVGMGKASVTDGSRSAVEVPTGFTKDGRIVKAGDKLYTQEGMLTIQKRMARIIDTMPEVDDFIQYLDGEGFKGDQMKWRVKQDLINLLRNGVVEFKLGFEDVPQEEFFKISHEYNKLATQVFNQTFGKYKGKNLVSNNIDFGLGKKGWIGDGLYPSGAAGIIDKIENSDTFMNITYGRNVMYLGFGKHLIDEPFFSVHKQVVTHGNPMSLAINRYKSIRESILSLGFDKSGKFDFDLGYQKTKQVFSVGYGDDLFKDGKMDLDALDKFITDNLKGLDPNIIKEFKSSIVKMVGGFGSDYALLMKPMLYSIFYHLTNHADIFLKGLSASKKGFTFDDLLSFVLLNSDVRQSISQRIVNHTPNNTIDGALSSALESHYNAMVESAKEKVVRVKNSISNLENRIARIDDDEIKIEMQDALNKLKQSLVGYERNQRYITSIGGARNFAREELLRINSDFINKTVDNVVVYNKVEDFFKDYITKQYGDVFEALSSTKALREQLERSKKSLKSLENEKQEILEGIDYVMKNYNEDLSLPGATKRVVVKVEQEVKTLIDDLKNTLKTREKIRKRNVLNATLKTLQDELDGLKALKKDPKNIQKDIDKLQKIIDQKEYTKQVNLSDETKRLTGYEKLIKKIDEDIKTDLDLIDEKEILLERLKQELDSIESSIAIKELGTISEDVVEVLNNISLAHEAGDIEIWKEEIKTLSKKLDDIPDSKQREMLLRIIKDYNTAASNRLDNISDDKLKELIKYEREGRVIYNKEDIIQDNKIVFNPLVGYVRAFKTGKIENQDPRVIQNLLNEFLPDYHPKIDVENLAEESKFFYMDKTDPVNYGYIDIRTGRKYSRATIVADDADIKYPELLHTSQELGRELQGYITSYIKTGDGGILSPEIQRMIDKEIPLVNGIRSVQSNIIVHSKDQAATIPLLVGDTIYDITTKRTSFKAEKLKNLDGFVNHSGGALGSDYIWGKVGGEYGVKSNHYYVEGFKNTDYQNFSLTKEEASVADEFLMKANERLKRKFPTSKEGVNNLLRRNYYQVKNADEVFAIGKIEGDNVAGGTGWAVAMAQDMGREIHVFNEVDKKWYKWDGDTFVLQDTPILTQNFAGIGTRSISPEGMQAIRDVYKKTLEEGVYTIPTVKQVVPKNKIIQAKKQAEMFIYNTGSKIKNIKIQVLNASYDALSTQYDELQPGTLNNFVVEYIEKGKKVPQDTDSIVYVEYDPKQILSGEYGAINNLTNLYKASESFRKFVDDITPTDEGSHGEVLYGINRKNFKDTHSNYKGVLERIFKGIEIKDGEGNDIGVLDRDGNLKTSLFDDAVNGRDLRNVFLSIKNLGDYGGRLTEVPESGVEEVIHVKNMIDSGMDIKFFSGEEMDNVLKSEEMKKVFYGGYDENGKYIPGEIVGRPTDYLIGAEEELYDNFRIADRVVLRELRTFIDLFNSGSTSLPSKYLELMASGYKILGGFGDKDSLLQVYKIPNDILKRVIKSDASTSLTELIYSFENAYLNMHYRDTAKYKTFDSWKEALLEEIGSKKISGDKLEQLIKDKFSDEIMAIKELAIREASMMSTRYTFGDINKPVSMYIIARRVDPIMPKGAVEFKKLVEEVVPRLEGAKTFRLYDLGYLGGTDESKSLFDALVELAKEYQEEGKNRFELIIKEFSDYSGPIGRSEGDIKKMLEFFNKNLLNDYEDGYSVANKNFFSTRLQAGGYGSLDYVNTTLIGKRKKLAIKDHIRAEGKDGKPFKDFLGKTNINYGGDLKLQHGDNQSDMSGMVVGVGVESSKIKHGIKWDKVSGETNEEILKNMRVIIDAEKQEHYILGEVPGATTRFFKNAESESYVKKEGTKRSDALYQLFSPEGYLRLLKYLKTEIREGGYRILGDIMDPKNVPTGFSPIDRALSELSYTHGVGLGTSSVVGAKVKAGTDLIDTIVRKTLVSGQKVILRKADASVSLNEIKLGDGSHLIKKIRQSTAKTYYGKSYKDLSTNEQSLVDENLYVSAYRFPTVSEYNTGFFKLVPDKNLGDDIVDVHPLTAYFIFSGDFDGDTANLVPLIGGNEFSKIFGIDILRRQKSGDPKKFFNFDMTDKEILETIIDGKDIDGAITKYVPNNKYGFAFEAPKVEREASYLDTRLNGMIAKKMIGVFAASFRTMKWMNILFNNVGDETYSNMKLKYNAIRTIDDSGAKMIEERYGKLSFIKENMEKLTDEAHNIYSQATGKIVEGGKDILTRGSTDDFVSISNTIQNMVIDFFKSNQPEFPKFWDIELTAGFLGMDIKNIIKKAESNDPSLTSAEKDLIVKIAEIYDLYISPLSTSYKEYKFNVGSFFDSKGLQGTFGIKRDLYEYFIEEFGEVISKINDTNKDEFYREYIFNDDWWRKTVDEIFYGGFNFDRIQQRGYAIFNQLNTKEVEDTISNRLVGITQKKNPVHVVITTKDGSIYKGNFAKKDLLKAKSSNQNPLKEDDILSVDFVNPITDEYLGKLNPFFERDAIQKSIVIGKKSIKILNKIYKIDPDGADYLRTLHRYYENEAKDFTLNDLKNLFGTKRIESLVKNVGKTKKDDRLYKMAVLLSWIYDDYKFINLLTQEDKVKYVRFADDKLYNEKRGAVTSFAIGDIKNGTNEFLELRKDIIELENKIEVEKGRLQSIEKNIDNAKEPNADLIRNQIKEDIELLDSKRIEFESLSKEINDTGVRLEENKSHLADLKNKQKEIQELIKDGQDREAAEIQLRELLEVERGRVEDVIKDKRREINNLKRRIKRLSSGDLENVTIKDIEDEIKILEDDINWKKEWIKELNEVDKQDRSPSEMIDLVDEQIKTLNKIISDLESDIEEATVTLAPKTRVVNNKQYYSFNSDSLFELPAFGTEIYDLSWKDKGLLVNDAVDLNKKSQWRIKLLVSSKLEAVVPDLMHEYQNIRDILNVGRSISDANYASNLHLQSFWPTKGGIRWVLNKAGAVNEDTLINNIMSKLIDVINISGDTPKYVLRNIDDTFMKLLKLDDYGFDKTYTQQMKEAIELYQKDVAKAVVDKLNELQSIYKYNIYDNYFVNKKGRTSPPLPSLIRDVLQAHMGDAQFAMKLQGIDDRGKFKLLLRDRAKGVTWLSSGATEMMVDALYKGEGDWVDLFVGLAKGIHYNLTYGLVSSIFTGNGFISGLTQITPNYFELRAYARANQAELAGAAKLMRDYNLLGSENVIMFGTGLGKDELNNSIVDHIFDRAFNMLSKQNPKNNRVVAHLHSLLTNPLGYADYPQENLRKLVAISKALNDMGMTPAMLENKISRHGDAVLRIFRHRVAANFAESGGGVVSASKLYREQIFSNLHHYVPKDIPTIYYPVKFATQTIGYLMGWAYHKSAASIEKISALGTSVMKAVNGDWKGAKADLYDFFTFGSMMARYGAMSLGIYLKAQKFEKDNNHRMDFNEFYKAFNNFGVSYEIALLSRLKTWSVPNEYKGSTWDKIGFSLENEMRKILRIFRQPRVIRDIYDYYALTGVEGEPNILEAIMFGLDKHYRGYARYNELTRGDDIYSSVMGKSSLQLFGLGGKTYEQEFFQNIMDGKMFNTYKEKPFYTAILRSILGSDGNYDAGSFNITNELTKMYAERFKNDPEIRKLIQGGKLGTEEGDYNISQLIGEIGAEVNNKEAVESLWRTIVDTSFMDVDKEGKGIYTGKMNATEVMMLRTVEEALEKEGVKLEDLATIKFNNPRIILEYMAMLEDKYDIPHQITMSLYLETLKKNRMSLAGDIKNKDRPRGAEFIKLTNDEILAIERDILIENQDVLNLNGEFVMDVLAEHAKQNYGDVASKYEEEFSNAKYSFQDAIDFINRSYLIGKVVREDTSVAKLSSPYALAFKGVPDTEIGLILANNALREIENNPFLSSKEKLANQAALLIGLNKYTLNSFMDDKEFAKLSESGRKKTAAWIYKVVKGANDFDSSLYENEVNKMTQGSANKGIRRSHWMQPPWKSKAFSGARPNFSKQFEPLRKMLPNVIQDAPTDPDKYLREGGHPSRGDSRPVMYNHAKNPYVKEYFDIMIENIYNGFESRGIIKQKRKDRKEFRRDIKIKKPKSLQPNKKQGKK